MPLIDRPLAELETYEGRNPCPEDMGEYWTRALAERVTTPTGRVLVGTGLMDTICPPSTQFAAYNKVGSKKQMLLYADFGHEDIPEWSDRAFEFLRDAVELHATDGSARVAVSSTTIEDGDGRRSAPHHERLREPAR